MTCYGCKRTAAFVRDLRPWCSAHCWYVWRVRRWIMEREGIMLTQEKINEAASAPHDSGQSESAQRRVFAAVQARGYVNGWLEAQFVARQACKLQEELGEVFEAISYREYGPLTDDAVTAAADAARWDFDHKMQWIDHWSDDYDRFYDGNRARIASELADMQVVLFAAAERMDIDIVALAVEKAEADVTRGVR